VIYRLDPRAKLGSALLLMAGVLVSGDFRFYMVFGAFLGMAIVVSRVPPGFVLRNLRPFIWLLLLTFFLHAFFTQGRPLPPFPLLGISATMEGVEKGAFFSCRLAALVLLAALLTVTTAPIEMSDGLERILRPLRRFGIPAHELAMMMVISLRFIPTLLEEAEGLRKAQMARGADFSGGPVRRIKGLIPLLIPLFLSAFRRADHLALAMEARCYRGGEGRTSFRELSFGGRDYGALALAGSLFATGFVFK